MDIGDCHKREEIAEIVVIIFCPQSILVALKNESGTTLDTWTILSRPLLSFCALKVAVALLSMKGVKAHGLHQK